MFSNSILDYYLFYTTILSVGNLTFTTEVVPFLVSLIEYPVLILKLISSISLSVLTLLKKSVDYSMTFISYTSLP